MTEYTAPIQYELVSSAHELLMINKEFKACLKDNGLHGFADYWDNLDGETIKDIEERIVLRFNLPILNKLKTTPAKGQTFYIKKHRQTKVASHPEFYLQTDSEGTKEFHFFSLFRERGLATAVPVAAGMRVTQPNSIDSFFITRDFSPYVDLEELIFNSPHSLQGERNKTKRKNILKAIASYAGRMHSSGLNQKDFNATHILLHKLDTDRPEVAIFDLQRVDSNPWRRFRWPIKALAELCYTLPVSIFSEKEKLFLYHSYLQKARLSLYDRLIWNIIKRKIEKIGKHTQKRKLAPRKARP